MVRSIENYTTFDVYAFESNANMLYFLIFILKKSYLFSFMTTSFTSVVLKFQTASLNRKWSPKYLTIGLYHKFEVLSYFCRSLLMQGYRNSLIIQDKRIGKFIFSAIFKTHNICHAFFCLMKEGSQF